MPIAISPVVVAAAAAEELDNIFRDGFGVLGAGEGEYLKSGEPNSISGKVSQAAGRSACRVYATGNTGVSGRAALKYEKVCRPYLDSIYPPTGVGIENPFQGGQCPGVRYLLTYRGTLTDPATDTGPVQTIMRGPLSLDTSLLPGDVCNDGLTYKRWTLRGADNAATGLWAGCTASIEIISVVALDGGDGGGCGNPAPVVREPEPRPDPTPPPFRFNPGPDIDVDVDVDVDVDGRIIIDIGTGPITIDPFGPDGGGGGSGGGGGNDPVGGPGSPGDGGDTGEGGDESGQAEDGEELVGVLVEILSAPEGANRFFNNSELVYRGAYYVAMGYPGRLGLDMSGGTAETIQFFHAQQRGLTDYRVRANVGFNLRVTPYYRILEP